jgi:hypothetical protein
MVILMCRRSPACMGVEAKAPGVLRRTAELIPNQLNSQRFSRYTLSLILDTLTIGDHGENFDIH